jgi:hypothetical protein
MSAKCQCQKSVDFFGAVLGVAELDALILDRAHSCFHEAVAAVVIGLESLRCLCSRHHARRRDQ